jgi:hypothetical protein
MSIELSTKKNKAILMKMKLFGILIMLGILMATGICAQTTTTTIPDCCYEEGCSVSPDGAYAYYDVEYNEQEPNIVKFENPKDAPENGNDFQLGEEGRFETDTFTIVVDEEIGDLTVYTKAATVTGEVLFEGYLSGVCDTQDTGNGFLITIVSITYDEQTGYYTYVISVTAFCPDHALSNVKFDFGEGSEVLSATSGFLTGSAIIDPVESPGIAFRECGFSTASEEECDIELICGGTTTTTSSTTTTTSSTSSTSSSTTSTTEKPQNGEIPEFTTEGLTTIGIIAAVALVAIYLLKKK